jgi:hypothetical protein
LTEAGTEVPAAASLKAPDRQLFRSFDEHLIVSRPAIAQDIVAAQTRRPVGALGRVGDLGRSRLAKGEVIVVR